MSVHVAPLADPTSLHIVYRTPAQLYWLSVGQNSQLYFLNHALDIIKQAF